ncbi:break repair meiotic recombinase recruitment factor 1 isoform X2 [Herpailurus yagouaroundi]|uniref:break repair meiotic recombinase recruitment factor 1 isoform X2 n=1 Tax=Herpailurus yagouaroundi TaxID=1608482 RepID=UPI001AD710E7|nr:break repair meiotic recombinase recruitment factor 1 isoform X2 [Puma yagouaroundi]
MRGKEVERARRSRQTYPVPDQDRGTLTTSVAQISQRRDKMTKRKKLRTSGGEGIRPPKLPKNPRLGDSGRPPQSSEWGCLCLPEASEGRSGPVPSAEQRTEEPVQAASSSPAEEAQAPASLLGEPEKEPAPLPLSQETPPGPSSQQARSRLQEESLGLASWEARELGAQTQVDSTHPEHRDQNPMTPVPGSGDSPPSASTNVSPEPGMVPLASERASQDHLSEQGTNTPDGESRKGCWVLGYRGQKGLLLSSDAEEKEPDRGSLQEAGVQGGAEADLPEGHREKGDSVLGPSSTQGPEPGSADQALSDPMQIPSKTSREAEQSCSGPSHSSLGTVVITDRRTDPTEPEWRAPEVAKPDEQANTRAPSSPSGKAPDGGHSGVLLSCTLLTGETGGRREARLEDKPPGNILGGPLGSLALDRRIKEPIVGAGDSSLLASEVGPPVDQTRAPGLDEEGLGGICALPLLLQPEGEKAAELRSQSPKEDLDWFNLSLGAFAPPVHREAVGGPSQETRACHNHPDAPEDPTGWSELPPGSADQALLGESPAMEPHFLPDSQIRDALEVPDLAASPEQILQDEQETVLHLSHQRQSHLPAQISPSESTGPAGDTRLFPLGSRLDSCWPGTSLHADGGPLTDFQLRTCVGIKACEAARMEDATDTVHGLVVELSNLNRLIMSTHRDLEAFRRLNYRKARPAGKAPAPYTSKGAGNLPPGEQSWRDL